MGVTTKDIALLAALTRSAVPFTRSLTIGRQSLVTDASGVGRGLAEGGSAATSDEATRMVATSGGYAEPVFAHLGADRVDSLDASGYEGATYAHDMNEPLPTQLEEAYSFVFDGGSLEHVFHV